MTQVRGARSIVLAVAAALALPSLGAGQGSVHSAKMEADLAAEPGMAHIRIEYEVDGVAPGGEVPVSLVDFGTIRVEGFRIGVEGIPALLGEEYGAVRRGSWAVEAGTDGRALLRVAYRVPVSDADASGPFTVHLPVVNVGLVPEGARPGLFEAEVKVPGAWSVTEGFPTGLAAAPDAGVYGVALAVVPSVVTLRGRADGRGSFGLPLILDLFAGVVLLITAAVGWRHLRKPAP